MNKSSSPTVFTGDSLILHCSALGYPQPVVRWYKDGNFVHKNTSLHFSSLNQSDSGFYACNASSIAGSDAYKVQVLVRGRDEHVPLRISGNVFFPLVKEGPKCPFSPLLQRTISFCLCLQGKISTFSLAQTRFGYPHPTFCFNGGEGHLGLCKPLHIMSIFSIV